MISILSAYIYAFLISMVILFQLALALGVPWGEFSMGGKFPGRYPPAMRFSCIFQIAILSFAGASVLTRAGLIFPEWLDISRKVIWGVVAFSVLGVVLNFATPSKWERILWAPVAVILLVCSMVVAIS